MTGKHLRVEYNDVILFDGDVDEVVWSDGAAGVSVTGKIKRQAGGAGAGSFFEKLAAASKAKTADAVEKGHAELNSGQGDAGQ